MASVIFTIGYGKWSAGHRPQELLAALKNAGVSLLIDIRHSPCSPSLDPSNTYGPKVTNLQGGHAGIVPLLAHGGIKYLWAVELGNPQKNDPEMRILREHLDAGPASVWPVWRGLELVRNLVVAGERAALMCVCAKSESCHRQLIVQSLLKMQPQGAHHRELSG